MEAIRWLQEAGPKAPKHRGFFHPLATFVLHYAVVAVVTLSAHDWLTLTYSSKELPLPGTDKERQQSVGMFLSIYFLAYFSCRLALRWRDPEYYIEFYKQTFLCSVTIFHAAVGFSTNRPILAQSFCVAVGIDQILWYVDLSGYLILHKFPIGVSKYLFWPGTNWVSRLTSTHHLWTIPVVLWASGGDLHILALPLSLVVILVNIIMSRFLTPHSIAATEDPPRPSYYLNLNLAYELWSDIQMPFLLVLEDQVPYLIRLFFAWSFFNAIVFWLLRFIAHLTFMHNLGYLT